MVPLRQKLSWLAPIWTVALTLAAFGAEEPPQYQSPYALKFSFTQTELIGDLLDGKRGAPEQQSSVPAEAWSSAETLKRWGSWGPPARMHAPPEGAQSLEGKSAQWKRERVVAVALRYVGYRYQHHHIPDFDPPASWPRDTIESPPLEHHKGVDCSNFTSFVYSLALGIKFSSDIHVQADAKEARGPGTGNSTKLERIERPASYEEFIAMLRPGDLVFVKSRKKDEVSHVVMWIGVEKIGDAGDVKATPLILDSTGIGHHDKTGAAIPDGVQLRPFGRGSWYFQSASHVLRVIADDAGK